MTRVGDGRQNWVSSIKQTTSAVGNECTGLRGNSLASPIELRLIVNGQIGRRAFRNLFYMQPIGRMKSGDIFSTPFSPARRSLHALVFFVFFVLSKEGVGFLLTVWGLQTHRFVSARCFERQEGWERERERRWLAVGGGSYCAHKRLASSTPQQQQKHTEAIVKERGNAEKCWCWNLEIYGAKMTMSVPERKSGSEGKEEESEDESEILEESPCGRWQKRKEQVGRCAWRIRVSEHVSAHSKGSAPRSGGKSIELISLAMLDPPCYAMFEPGRGGIAQCCLAPSQQHKSHTVTYLLIRL